jgi:hypothetical protein
VNILAVITTCNISIEYNTIKKTCLMVSSRHIQKRNVERGFRFYIFIIIQSTYNFYYKKYIFNNFPEFREGFEPLRTLLVYASGVSILHNDSNAWFKTKQTLIIEFSFRIRVPSGMIVIVLDSWNHHYYWSKLKMKIERRRRVHLLKFKYSNTWVGTPRCYCNDKTWKNVRRAAAMAVAAATATLYGNRGAWITRTFDDFDVLRASARAADPA